MREGWHEQIRSWPQRFGFLLATVAGHVCQIGGAIASSIRSISSSRMRDTCSLVACDPTRNESNGF
jgi:hypothetical protein